MNNFNQNTNEIVLKASAFTENDLQNIPFDDFYLFLFTNQAHTLVGEEGRIAREESKLVGDMLLEKFKTAFQDEEVPLLPVGTNHSMATLTNRQNVNDVFKAHHRNQENTFNRIQTTNDLMQSVYKYHNATLQMNAESRQKSLSEINDTLKPFFTSSLKVVEAPKKKKRFGLF